MAAYGLYTHIQSNRRRSVVLLIGLFLLVYALVYAGALAAEGLSTNAPLDRLMRAANYDFLKAAPFATIGALIWIAIAYKFHQSMIDAMTGGHEVTRAEQPRLYNLLENLCISRGIPMPKLKVMDDEALNAFATGLNEKQYSISVTQGLLDSLNDQEVEAVLGHELTHIRNGDVRMLVIAVVIAGVISFFGEMVFRLFFQGSFYWGGGRSRSSDDRRGGGAGGIAVVIALVIVVVAWVLSIVIRFALSRTREYLADAGSVELTKNPDAMISALRKIEGHSELPTANSAVMEMCIDNPREEFANLFATHPSVEARVEALVRNAGGHDPGPLALPEDGDSDGGRLTDSSGNATDGPWGDAPASPPQSGSRSGPWGDTPGTDGPAQTPPAGPWGPHSDVPQSGPPAAPGQSQSSNTQDASGKPFLPGLPPLGGRWGRK